jgi:hypothetical protein
MGGAFCRPLQVPLSLWGWEPMDGEMSEWLKEHGWKAMRWRDVETRRGQQQSGIPFSDSFDKVRVEFLPTALFNSFESRS